MSALLNTLNKKVSTAQLETITLNNKKEKEKALHDSTEVIKNITKDMVSEAEKGHNNLKFYIVDNGMNSTLSTYQYFLQEYIITYFTKKGINVTKQYYAQHPSGSDDYYGCIVYSWWLNISW